MEASLTRENFQSENENLDKAIKEITNTTVYNDLEWENINQNCSNKSTQHQIIKKFQKRLKILKESL